MIYLQPKTLLPRDQNRAENEEKCLNPNNFMQYNFSFIPLALISQMCFSRVVQGNRTTNQ